MFTDVQLVWLILLGMVFIYAVISRICSAFEFINKLRTTAIASNNYELMKKVEEVVNAREDNE